MKIIDKYVIATIFAILLSMVSNNENELNKAHLHSSSNIKNKNFDKIKSNSNYLQEKLLKLKKLKSLLLKLKENEENKKSEVSLLVTKNKEYKVRNEKRSNDFDNYSIKNSTLNTTNHNNTCIDIEIPKSKNLSNKIADELKKLSNNMTLENEKKSGNNSFISNGFRSLINRQNIINFSFSQKNQKEDNSSKINTKSSSINGNNIEIKEKQKNIFKLISTSSSLTQCNELNANMKKCEFEFYSKDNFVFFTKLNDELNVIGSFYLKNISLIECPVKTNSNLNIDTIIINEIKEENFKSKYTKYCIKIIDLDEIISILEGSNFDNFINFVCNLDKFIEKGSFEICNKYNKKSGNVLQKKKQNNADFNINDGKIENIIIIPETSEDCNLNWDYNQLGDDWNCMCKSGKYQSPINLAKNTLKIKDDFRIKPVFKYKTDLKDKLMMKYENGILKLSSIDEIEIGNDNHFIDPKIKIHRSNKNNKDLLGFILDEDSNIYSAEEIVFHTPSEHHIEGKSLDLEMQIVHSYNNKKIIISFLFKKSPGIFNKFFEDIDFSNLPNKKYSKKEIFNNVNIYDIIPNDFSYYTYNGSLTHPPCTENVKFYVSDNVIPLSYTIIKMFEEALIEPNYKNFKGSLTTSFNESANNRILQKTNDREISYNS